jgi:hypothetical protein
VRIDGATAVVAPVPTAHETTTPEHSA